jgi:hypothetical protein
LFLSQQRHFEFRSKIYEDIRNSMGRLSYLLEIYLTVVTSTANLPLVPNVSGGMLPPVATTTLAVNNGNS